MRRPPSGKQRTGHRPVPTKPLYRRGILAGVIVAIGGGLAAYLMLGRPETSPDDGNRVATRIVENTPSKVISTKTPHATETTSNAEHVATSAQQDRGNAPDSTIEKPKIQVRKTDRMVTLPDGTRTNLNKKTLFKEPVDHFVSCALSPKGIAIPLRLVLNRFSEEQIRKVFHTDMVIEPGDSELIIERKAELQDIKERVRDLEKQGYTYEEIFDEIDSWGRETRAEVRFARQGLATLVKEGAEPEIIRDWIEEKNKRLAVIGEPPLTVPVQYREENKN